MKTPTTPCKGTLKKSRHTGGGRSNVIVCECRKLMVLVEAASKNSRARRASRPSQSIHFSGRLLTTAAAISVECTLVDLALSVCFKGDTYLFLHSNVILFHMGYAIQCGNASTIKWNTTYYG